MKPTKIITLAIDLEAEFSTRRPVTVADHALFLDSLLTEADHDEIDEFVGEFSPSQTKSGKEISRLLNLLDNLPTGKDSQ
jgi:hypothetical protein